MSTIANEMAHADGGVSDGGKADARPRFSASILRRCLRQPLVQFLLIGIAIFVLAQLLADARESNARTIVVDSARAQRLAELYRVQMGTAPPPSELEYLIDSHIRDEILYREALKMGLDRDDEIIRRRLIQKMEFLQNDLSPVADPTEAALRAYYAQHAPEFTIAGTATFTHIYFSADVVGDEAAQRTAQTRLTALATSDAAVALGLGDPFPLQQSYSELDEQSAAQIFGHTPFIEALFNAPERRWSGPFRSGYGWHLIYVSRRSPQDIKEFGAAKEQVREAYVAERKRAANEERYRALEARYNVVRTTDESVE